MLMKHATSSWIVLADHEGWLVNYYKHLVRVLDLTYFSRSQRSKFKKNYESWHILLLFDLECSNLVWICIWAPSTFTQTFGPIELQIWPWGLVAILENQLNPITVELMAGSFPNFCHRYVFDLTYFSRSQRSKFETNYEVDIFCYYMTWKDLTLHERISWHHLHFYQISGQSDFKYGYQDDSANEKKQSSVQRVICRTTTKKWPELGGCHEGQGYALYTVTETVSVCANLIFKHFEVMTRGQLPHLEESWRTPWE
jgi:hypothetical protein